jgi:hypothetical protein
MIGRELEFDIGEEPEELLTQTLTRLALISNTLGRLRSRKYLTPYRSSADFPDPYLGRRDSCAKKSAQIGEGVVLLRRKAFHEVLTDTHLLVSVVNFMKGLLIMQSYNAMRGCNQFSTPPTVDAIFKSECIARWHTAFVLVPSMI